MSKNTGDLIDEAVELQQHMRSNYRDVDMTIEQCVTVVLAEREAEQRANAFTSIYQIPEENGPGIIVAVTGDGRTYTYRAPSHCHDPHDAGWYRFRNDGVRVEPE